MVLYFESSVVSPPVKIYMGKDKFESIFRVTVDEELIKYGVEEDVWFHVDNLSSAHIYYRLAEGEDWNNLPESLLEDLAQLTKANSIEGNKKDNITVIYTPWSNLKKTAGLETGQVTFFNQKLVKKIFVAKRKNEIVNRLNKTKQELYPDLNKLKVEHERLKREKLKKKQEKPKKQEKQPVDKSYTSLMDEKNMKTNFYSQVDNEKDFVNNAEEDFM